MITNPSQFLELQRVHMEALSSVGNALLAGAEKLAALNVSAGRNAIDSATEAAHSLAGAKDPKAVVALSGASAQPQIDKLVSYARELMGIANGVSVEIGKVVEKQITESNRHLAELIDYAAKNAPAGSEQAVAMLRSAVAAGNTAFDTLSKVTRQSAGWTETAFNSAAKAATTAAAAGAAATGKAFS